MIILDNFYKNIEIINRNIVLVKISEPIDEYKNSIDIFDLNQYNILYTHTNNNHKKTQNFNHAEIINKKYPNLRCLIIEDDVVNRSVIIRILEKLGITADFSDNFSKIRQKIKTQNYDILICDYYLKHFNGIDIMNEIKKNNNDIDLKILMTASIDNDIIEKSSKIGYDEILEKPYEIKILSNLFDKYFESSEKKIREIDQTKNLLELKTGADFPDIKYENKFDIIKEKNKYIVLILVEELKKDIITINEALEKEDYDIIIKTAHRRLGGAGQLKLLNIYNTLKAIITYSEKKESEKIKNCILNLEELTKKLSDIL